ncbi:CubicO group peptidase (beta-lactamase class C family) [Actinoplanes lutulentus]|uniref:CubicO group peptidase (Beta-lactamase class C family) n=1 Tax=Actinoplanes lutulentus TaxID=1287878 RepID=A0A327Z9J0_9ACTN|nr:serine hydrolase domain-containing protein [Actinoplanes lutulentus]MBB2948275.1 CubicO group peptidase (beta-lactamase class C family) [Actinoplanes lutulentus]RAK31228.1 CubicO group peptidase (beta-lactamase class C family) [Actinoplanes lutulentus]
MTPLAQIDRWLSARFADVLAANRVPGAAIAVAVGDDIVEHAAGVLNTATGVPATTDSVFQVGSITKPITATLVMQLADEGRVELDAPVRRYLPDFRVADETASAAITVRHLLAHTAGFGGDVFTDTGRNDDAIERYVAALAEVDQVFAPGTMFSYNNAAYVVLGRLIETLRGRPYAACLREGVIEPLGLTHTALGAEQAIMFRAAAGHVSGEPGEPEKPAPVWNLPAAHAPAGSLLAMRPRDLIAFARLHLRDGTGPDGTAVLSPASVAAMRVPQVTLPAPGRFGDSWGLGWDLGHWPGGTVIGHSGGTLGQSSDLRIVPAADVSIAFVQNGGEVAPTVHALTAFLLRELAGVEVPGLPLPPARPERVDPERYAGVYVSPAGEIVVSGDEHGRLWMEQRPAGIFAEFGGAEPAEQIVPLDDDVFVPARLRLGWHRPVTFLGDDGQGRSQFLHSGRASRRVVSS